MMVQLVCTWHKVDRIYCIVLCVVMLKCLKLLRSAIAAADADVVVCLLWHATTTTIDIMSSTANKCMYVHLMSSCTTHNTPIYGYILSITFHWTLRSLCHFIIIWKPKNVKAMKHSFKGKWNIRIPCSKWSSDLNFLSYISLFHWGYQMHSFNAFIYLRLV